MQVLFANKNHVCGLFIFISALFGGNVLAQFNDINVPIEETNTQTEEEISLSKAEQEFENSDEQGQVSLDESFGPMTAREKVHAQRKKALQDTKVEVQLRSYFLNRDRFDGSESEALALGGAVGIKTGYFRDRFAFGATAFTSQRLYGPKDKDGTDLLAPNQQGYGIIGEVYGQYLLMDGITLDFGRKRFNSAFINESDTRMTPNTFQAAVLLGQLGGNNGSATWRFGGGYFDKMKEKTSEKFISMATAAGAMDGVERGVYVGGANFKSTISSGEWSIGAIDYYSPDILNIFYTETKYTFPLANNTFLQLSAQYIAQKSTGDNLQFGMPFSANQIGLKAELAIADALITTSWNGNGNDGDLQSPWGGIPSYNSVQVQDFNYAGADSFLLRAGYQFKSVPSLSAYALWVNGSQPNNLNLSAEDEYDFNLQWLVGHGIFKGLSMRVRYALVTQENGGDNLNDFRIIFNYDPPVR